MVDVGFVLRETAATAKDLQRECDSVREMVALRFGALKMKVALTGSPEEADFSAEGELAKGIADAKPTPKLPKRGTPEDIALMAHFGIAPEHAHLMKLSWNQIQLYLEKLIVEGGELPPGLEIGPKPKITLSLRRRSDCDLEMPEASNEKGS